MKGLINLEPHFNLGPKETTFSGFHIYELTFIWEINSNSKMKSAKYSFAYTLLFVVVSLASYGQNNKRIYKGFNQKEDRIEVYVNDGTYVIKPYSDKIMETSFVPKGETFDPHSYSVVLKPNDSTPKELTEEENNLSYSTPGISVQIIKSPFKISYYLNDNYLVSEKEGYVKSKDYETIRFNLDSTEVLYGGGERVLGMNHRGYRLQLYNRAHYGYTTHSELMNYSMPLVVSSNKYTLHFDNAPIGYLDLDSANTNTLTYETIAGRMTYQVVAGETWPELMDAYTDLTGKQPLIPRWALGNFSSRFGYHSEKETRETVQKFIDNNIPLDAVIIDIYWFGKYIKGHMGNLAFLKDSFPTPDQMIADFKAKGVKTILVTEPFILTTSNRWLEAVNNNVLGTDSLGKPFEFDFYFGHTGLVDIFKPEARNWFWNIYKELTNQGVGGWWGDLGEPEVHPSKLQHVVGSADMVHNVYGHTWTKMVYEGYQKDFPNQRPFILMRSGAPGSQHYGIIPWTGDVSRSWGGLKPQPELALGMGLQGIGFMHSDLGGFAGGEVFDPELYARWLQYGVFQPIFRPHAQEHIAPEPVFHEVKVMELAKKAIELRYELIPYNYTTAFENNQTGLPLMRPLFFEEPENTKLYAVSDTYLWGDNFLISPVLDQGLKEKQVYFPSTSNWFDFYTGDKYEAGIQSTIPIVSDHIPVFVRGGAFIPMADVVQSTKHYSTKHLNLHYYFDPSVTHSDDVLYDDDGETPNNFEHGKYELLKFEAAYEESNIELNFTASVGDHYNFSARTIELTAHNLSNKPKKIKLAGKKIPFTWSEKKQILSISFEWTEGQPIPISIQF